MNVCIRRADDMLPCLLIQPADRTHRFLTGSGFRLFICRSNSYTSACISDISERPDLMILIQIRIFDTGRCRCSFFPYGLQILCAEPAVYYAEYHGQCDDTQDHSSHKDPVPPLIVCSKFHGKHPDHRPVIVRSKAFSCHILPSSIRMIRSAIWATSS